MQDPFATLKYVRVSVVVKFAKSIIEHKAHAT